MKRIALGFFAIATLIGTPTLAADITLPPRAAPPTTAAPAAGWTGFYLGGSFGGRFDGTKWNTTCIDPADPPGCPLGGGVNPLRLTNNNPATFQSTSFRGGIFGGYNYQLNAMWVVGVEGDFGWADNNSKTIAGIPGAENPTIVGSPGLDTASVKETWDAGARLRAGYLITPRLMVFATGGASWLRVQASAFCGSPFVVGWCIGPPGPTNVGSTSAASATVLGWTVGGGLEWMLTQNWLLRGEYRYADYQQFNYTLFPGNAAGGVGTDAILANTKTHTQTLSGGLAYKF